MALQLKILFTTTGLTKTMRFTQTMSVSETLRDIKDKTNEGGRDHGLFQPPDEKIGRFGRWLRPDKTLLFYDIKAGETIEVKKKHRPLKVKLLDETIKTVMIDESEPVSEIVEMIGKKMGLRNPEEFALQYNEEDQPPKEGDTLKKKKKKDRPSVLKKLPSAEAKGWLNPTQTLVEQGLLDDSVVTLKKKFYVDDDRVDRSDPVQLHLVYVQCHESVVKGDHPVTRDEAIAFGALQCQIVYGNFDPTKHNKSFYKEKKLDELISKTHRSKGLYDPLVQEWKKLVNMSEVNAKYRYVQLCRSLKTYGITYYRGKWKPKGKKRLEELMLGVTKENIICMHPETRQIEEEHPLIHLKRWAAGPNSFTLDFGDYRDEYIIIGTPDAEAISQQLAGYIDILLKKRKDGGVVIEDDEGERATEEHVGTVHGLAIQSVTTSDYGGTWGDQGSSAIMGGGGQFPGLSPGMAGMLGSIGNLVDADNAIMSMMNDLLIPLPIGQHGGKTPEQLRQELCNLNNALAAAAGALIRDAGNGLPRSELNKHAGGLATNLANLISAAKLAAAANGGDISLLDGAKAVSDALKELMNAAGELADNPSALSKARLLEAAASLQATSAALNATAQGKYADEDSKNLLLASAAAVAAAAKDLMNTSAAATASADPGTRNAQAEGARRVEFGSGKVSATAEAVAPVAVDPTCQKYMVDAARALTDSCGGLVSGIQAGVRDPQQRNDLARAAKAATEALQQLVNSTLCVGSRTQANREAMAAAAFEIQDAVARLMSSEGNPNLIITASRSVASAQGQLIQAAKSVANESDPEEKNRLFKGVADLTAAVKNMLATASPAANDPSDKQAHKTMRDAATLVADATKHILGDITTREAAMAALRTASKAVAANTSTLVADCKGVGSQLDYETYSSLVDSANQAASPTAGLVAAVKDSWTSPTNPEYDNRLMHAAAALARPATGLVAVSRSCVTKLKDPQSKLQLNTAATQVTDALKKMLEALSAVKESGGHMEVDEALEAFAATAADLDYALLSAQEGNFAAMPGQSREGALAILKRAADQLRDASDDLVDKAKVSPQAMGAPAKATTSAVGQVFGAAKAVASTTDERVARVKILSSAKDVASAIERLINAGRAVSNNPTEPELNNNLNSALLVANEEIDKLLAAVQNMGAGSEECDAAADVIAKGAIESLTGFGMGSTADLQELADELAALTKALDAAIGQVADSARNNPKALGGAASLTASTMPPIMKTANNAAAKTTDAVVSEHILVSGKKLADDTISALQTAKGVTANPGDYHRDQHLSNAVKAVKEDIRELLKAVDAAIPGKKELIEAQEKINSATDRLVHPSAPRGNAQMHLKEVTDAARALADSVGRIVASARNFPEKLGPYSKQAADSVSDIVDASKDASSSDPASVVLLSAKKLHKDSQKIADDPHDVTNVFDGAKDVARDSLHLIASVKDAAQKEADSAARRDLILAAEKCAQVTQQLAGAAKSTAKHEPGAEQKLQQATTNLQGGLKALMAYNKTNGGPDFKPLLEAAGAVANETGKMIEVLKVVAGKHKDASAQTQLAVTAKSTTDAIKQVIQAAEGLTYGHKECKEAIEVIQRAIGDLDAAAISATVGLLEAPVGGPSNQQCKEELITLSRDLATATGKLVGSAKESPENLGPAAKETSVIVPNVVESAKRLAATTSDSETQQAQLQLAKNMIDAMLALVQNTRASSSNPYDKETQENLAASTRQVSSAITELVSSLKGGVMGLRQCDEAIAAVEAQLANLGKAAAGPKKSYAQAGDELTKQTRELVGGIGKINSVAKNDPENVGAVTQVVANVVPQLVVAINTAIASAADEEVKQKLLNGGKDVIIAARDAISAAKNVAADPKNSNAMSLLSQQQRQVTQSIGNLLNAIREGAVLERDAEYASARIQAAIAELDSASLFAAATAGQLEVELAAGQNLDSCQTTLSAGVRAALDKINNITKSTNPSGSQEALGKAYRDFADQIEKMGKDTKNVASLLGDLVAQQDVLTAGKAVAIASQACVLASKEAMTHGDDRAAQADFKEKTTGVTNAINDLIRVSETASAEATKGIRECEKAEREIAAQLANFANAQWSGNRNGSAEDVVKSARVVAAASGNVVSTCTNDHVGLVTAANGCNKGIVQMLADAKGAAQLTDDPKVQDDLTNAVQSTAKATLALLNAAKTAKDTQESQKNMSTLSEAVADRILEVVGAARRLPGGAGLRLEEDTGDDLENLAERELMKAAKMIEDAAKRLLEARPRKVKAAGEQLNEEDINSAILDAARAITEATGALVKAATAAQRERIAKSRDPSKKHFYRKDPAWANGLISAAQTVGGTTQDLVSSANGFVKKEADSDEDILIASAKQVAAATARLMAASRAKSDPFSDSHKNLAAASKAVAAATQSLVEAAKMAGKALNEPEEIESALDDISAVQARKEQLKRQAEMLRLEKELEKARTAYTKLNKDAYAPTNLSAPTVSASASSSGTFAATTTASPRVTATPTTTTASPRPVAAAAPAASPARNPSPLVSASPRPAAAAPAGAASSGGAASPWFAETEAPAPSTPVRAPVPGGGAPPPALTRPPAPGGGAPPPVLARPPAPGGGAPPPVLSRPPAVGTPPPALARPAAVGTPPAGFPRPGVARPSSASAAGPPPSLPPREGDAPPLPSREDGGAPPSLPPLPGVGRPMPGSGIARPGPGVARPGGGITRPPPFGGRGGHQ